MTTVENATGRRVAEVEHLSVEKRVALGKAARARTPRSGHAEFRPAADRPDPIDLLEQQAQSRVPELVPIRYGRMLVSPFTFYRGAALLHGRRPRRHARRPGSRVQLCGDAHLSNFGVFASPERRLVFDINDFDETLPGAVGVGREAAGGQPRRSPGRENGYPAGRARVDRAMRRRARYRETHARVRQPRPTSRSGTRTSTSSDLMRAMPAAGDPRRAQARRGRRSPRPAHATAMQAFDEAHPRWSTASRGSSSDPPLIVPIERAARRSPARADLRRELHRLLRATARPSRRPPAPARGVPAGRRRAQGGRRRQRRHPGLDRAAARPRRRRPAVPAGEGGAGLGARAVRRQEPPSRPTASGWSHGQHLMQATSDIFLGWTAVTGIDGVHRDFYVRQLRDWKGVGDVEPMVPHGHATCTRACAAGRWPAPTPAPATGSRSAPTWVPATPSTGPSPTSPRPTPTRTNGTTRRSPTPLPAAGSRPRRVCDGATAPDHPKRMTDPPRSVVG